MGGERARGHAGRDRRLGEVDPRDALRRAARPGHGRPARDRPDRGRASSPSTPRRRSRPSPTGSRRTRRCPRRSRRPGWSRSAARSTCRRSARFRRRPEREGECDEHRQPAQRHDRLGDLALGKQAAALKAKRGVRLRLRRAAARPGQEGREGGRRASPPPPGRSPSGAQAPRQHRPRQHRLRGARRRPTSRPCHRLAGAPTGTRRAGRTRRRCGPDAGSTMALRCPRRPSSICTSTPSTRSWTAPAGSRRWPRGRPSWRCRRSRSPTTARSPARSSCTARRRIRGSSRSSAASSTSPTTARRQEKGYAHLTVLAESNEGYANLIKLSSLGYLEGYYYKPRVDWELLERHAQGLVVLSGCLSGRVSKALEEARPQDAAADLDRLVQIFGTRLDVRRDPERRPRAAAADQPAAGQARRGDRPAARRHRRRPLPAARGRARPRGPALHPVRRLAEEPESLALRHRPVLLQDPGRDGGGLRRLPGRAAADARGRRALQRRARARPDPAAEVPDAGRARRVRLPRRAVRGRARAPLRAASRPSSATASSSS